MKPDNIILEAILGSKAYGLDTATSDTDIKGIYLLPLEKVLSLGFNSDNTTKDHTNPDWVYHEVQKYIKLALNGNPTITELLWVTDYTVMTPIGKLLVDNRDIFLSQAYFKSYGGYALGQAKDLNRRGGTYGHGRGNRYEKHTRHCFRLLMQGKELLETGKLTVRVTPEQREELFAIGKESPEVIMKKFTEAFQPFKDDSPTRIKSILPLKPDREAANKLLLQIRELTHGKSTDNSERSTKNPTE